MTKLKDCLLTEEPRVLEFPAGTEYPSDPARWALEMFASNIREADMQSRNTGSEKRDSKVTYFDQNHDDSFERFRHRVENNLPVHGSLPVIDYCSGDGTVRDNADWASQIFYAHFKDGLDEHHPAGNYLRASLWTSCGDHLYEVHNDPFDGFLFHFSGRKRVRVWPVPRKYRQRVIFSHRDFKGRMASTPMDFDLEPGQVLFMPTGAMHEVVAYGDRPAVSVSFHMGSPFPMLTLCAQLNLMVQGGKITLPPYMKKLDKFNLFYFEPTRFIDKNRNPDDPMPEQLLRALSGTLRSKQVDLRTMRRMLSNWWRLLLSRPMYPGPFPERSEAFKRSVR